MRVLIAGWPSFLNGEPTAGDVLAMETVHDVLSGAGISAEMVWSPVFRPGGLSLAEAEPERYSHLVFVSGPAHGEQVRRLHTRYGHCHRIAVGVSVIDPTDPAILGFHEVLARDGGGEEPRRDLAAGRSVGDLPVVGVVLSPTQVEYGGRRRNDEIEEELGQWLASRTAALIPLETRLESYGWRTPGSPAQVEAIVRRLDLVVTMSLHGLVLALKNGVPALAVDPIEGGAKVSAQARAWQWPALVTAESGTPPLVYADLERHWEWCLSGYGSAAAWQRTGAARPPLTRDLLRVLGIPEDCHS